MSTATAALLYTSVDSPIGELLLLSDGRALRGVHMQEGRSPIAPPPGSEPSTEPFSEATVQLAEYFSGQRTVFDLPLVMDGTPFQQRVWGALQDIPYGTTISYGELARRVGQPTASRAVGLANGRNPIAIVVPCHRVIGADGTLTGYGGGLERKQFLLNLEIGALPLKAEENAPRCA